MVAGHEEVLAVLRDTASTSNCDIVAGPSFRDHATEMRELRPQVRRRHGFTSMSCLSSAG
jgi:hypothetical protein